MPARFFSVRLFVYICIMKQIVEYIEHFHGQYSLYLGDDKGVTCSANDVREIFQTLLGKKIQNDYIDGCTIFQVSDAQIEKIKTYLDGR